MVFLPENVLDSVGLLCFSLSFLFDWIRFCWLFLLLIITSRLIGSNPVAGGRTVRRAFEFGRTYVVRPKGRHQATVVWLHGLGDNGSR